MKQKRKVSVIGALVLIIGAVALITGCTQPNSNKGNNSGNTGGSSINLAGTVWYSGGYGYLYFSSNKAYMCYHNNGTVTINSSGTYSKDKMIMNGESISILSITESVLKIPAPNEIDTITYTRETDISLINKIKSACH